MKFDWESWKRCAADLANTAETISGAAANKLPALGDVTAAGASAEVSTLADAAIASIFPASVEAIQEVLHEATEWRAMQTTLQKAQEDIKTAIRKVGELNDAPGYRAFTAHMAAEDSAPAVIGDSATGCGQMAFACEAVAKVVLGLKILVIGQLVTLAAAIAAAVMSGGLAAGGVVLARKIAVDAITTAVTDAVAKLLEE